jgi:tetratricopeptide (TPR) repeat protein
MTFTPSGLHHTVSTGVTLMALIGVLACSADPVAKAERFVASGDRYLSNGQLNEAVIEYARAIQARPEWAGAHYKQAETYLALSDPSKAYASFSRAASLDPTNAHGHIQAGALLLSAGQFDEARTRAQQALEIQSQNAAAYTLLGNALAGLRQPDRALEQIEQALALDPSYAPAWTAMGIVKAGKGPSSEASEAFARAVVLAPASVPARLALAQYQWATGDPQKAEQTLKATLEFAPNDHAVHRVISLLYMTTGRALEAEPHLTALARDPTGRLALADYYLALNRPDDARPLLEELAGEKNKALALAARLRIAGTDYAAGRKADAYRTVDALIAEQPKEADVKLAKARLLLADGDPTQASKYAREALQTNHDSAQAHYTMGLAALASHKLDDAESAFRHVIRINPRAAVAELQLARLHLAKGEPTAAVTASQRAVQLEPRDPTAVVMMVRSLRAAGNLSRAREELVTRLAQQPISVALQLEMGAVALEGKDFPAARRAFQAALHNQPGLYDARAGLVATKSQLTSSRERGLLSMAGCSRSQQADPFGCSSQKCGSPLPTPTEPNARSGTWLCLTQANLKPTTSSGGCIWRKGSSIGR